VSDRLGSDSQRDTFFAGLFARLKPKIEAKGAAWAVAHRTAEVVWLLLHEGVGYQEKGVAPVNPRTLVRKFRRLTQELARAGLDGESLSLLGPSGSGHPVGGISGVLSFRVGAQRSG
jgi:hypothetical protein